MILKIDTTMTQDGKLEIKEMFSRKENYTTQNRRIVCHTKESINKNYSTVRYGD